MVKLDYNKNYYAELEVTPKATLDEIKKQFRKLALKYHPDRNPGKEDECIARFQAIQAAHEILIDPEQRQKYDAERNKRGLAARSLYTSTQAPQPAHPFTARAYYASPFPPPPQRNTRASSAYATGASTASTSTSGADRFTNFPKPPPTSRRESAREDAGSQANVFTAWQYMNPGARAQSTYARDRTGSFRPQAAADRARAYDQSQQRAQSSHWESTRGPGPGPGLGRNNTTRTPRKNGFDPATPGADEPAVTGKAGYFTSHRQERQEAQASPSSANGYDTPPTSRASSEEKIPTRGPFGRRSQEEAIAAAAAAAARAPSPLHPESSSRLRTPYHSTPGERTNVSGSGLRRSASTRETSFRPSEGQNTTSNRASKLSQEIPLPRTAKQRSASTSPGPKTPLTSENVSPHAAKTSPSANDGPSVAKETGAKYGFIDISSDTSSEEDSDDDELSDKDDENLSRPAAAPRASANDAKPRSEAASPMADRRRPMAKPSSIWAMRDKRKPSESLSRSRPNSRDHAQRGMASEVSDGSGSGGKSSNPAKFSRSEWDGAFASGSELFARPPMVARASGTSRMNAARPGGFARGRSSSQSAIPMQQREASNIGKKTSTQNHTSPQQPTPTVPSGPAAISVNTAIQSQPGFPAADALLPESTDSPTNNLQKPNFAPLPGEVKFSAEQWAQTLKSPNWVLPPLSSQQQQQPPNQQQPTRLPSPDKRSRSAKSKTGMSTRNASAASAPLAATKPPAALNATARIIPKPATVSEEVDESEEGGSGSGSGSSAAKWTSGPSTTESSLDDDENAMDIDDEPLVNNESKEEMATKKTTEPLYRHQELHAREMEAPARPTAATASAFIAARRASGAASSSATGAATFPTAVASSRRPIAVPRSAAARSATFAVPTAPTSSSTSSSSPAKPAEPSTNLNLHSLKTVTPIQPSSNSGLGDLDPMKQTLPFPSAASTSNPLKHSLSSSNSSSASPSTSSASIPLHQNKSTSNGNIGSSNIHSNIYHRHSSSSPSSLQRPFPSSSTAAAGSSTAAAAPTLLTLHSLPPIPSTPRPPHRLTRATWSTYLNVMTRYAAAHHAFNRTMLAHFNARQTLVDAGGLQRGWLAASGEPSGTGGVVGGNGRGGSASGGGGAGVTVEVGGEKRSVLMGFDGYVAALREDEEMRRYWERGCLAFREAMEAFGRVRERVRRGIGG